MARPQHGGMRDMTQGSPAKQILLFTLPLLVGNFLQQLYNMVDSWVVGNYVSDAALAAVGTGFPVIFFFSSLFMGLSTGGTVVIAQFYGAGQMDRVHDAVDTIYAAFLRMILPMTAVAMLVAKPLLHVLRVDAAAMDEALTYLLVVCGGLIGSVGYNFNAGILNGLGNSRTTLLFLSVPISLSGLLESMSISLAAIMVGGMGQVELAAHQIVNSLSQLSFMVATGIGAAATIRVSFQYGAGKKEETVMAANASIHMSLFYMGACGLLFVALRHLLPSVYSNDPAVTALASKLIIVLALFQVADAVQLASMASLRGLKDTKVPMVYSLISYYLVAIPSGYLLGFTAGLGPAGVWVGLLLGLFAAAILFYVRFLRICRRKGLLPARRGSE